MDGFIFYMSFMLEFSGLKEARYGRLVHFIIPWGSS